MNDYDTIRTKSKDPGGGVLMLKKQYFAIEAFILELLSEEKSISAMELINKCYERFHPMYESSTGVLVYNVKIDLEVRGIIVHHRPVRRRALAMVSRTKNDEFSTNKY